MPPVKQVLFVTLQKCCDCLPHFSWEKAEMWENPALSKRDLSHGPASPSLSLSLIVAIEGQLQGPCTGNLVCTSALLLYVMNLPEQVQLNQVVCLSITPLSQILIRDMLVQRATQRYAEADLICEGFLQAYAGPMAWLIRG